MSDDASAATSPAVRTPGLVLVSTPIGNPDDLSTRARHVLTTADLVLCEDTRRTRRLMAAIGARARLATLHEHNEDARIPELLGRLREGATIALVSDAGMPLVSDPGYRLVRAAIADAANITAVPGPNAAVTALVLSGLPPLPFLVLGFPPPRAAARQAAFARLRAVERAGLAATLIWYEAPHRLGESLADMAEAFGDRPAAVCRELTKRFEEVRRGTLPTLAARYATEPARGEITVVLGPAPARPAEADDLDACLREALRSQTMRDAATLVAKTTGLPRRVVYARAVALAGGER